MDRRLRSSQLCSSTSSLYVTDEEEGPMEVEERKYTVKKKMARSDRSVEDSGDEERMAPARAKRNVREEEGAKGEIGRMERVIQVMRQKAADEEKRRQKEEEMMQKKAVEEQRRIREEEERSENETDERKIDKVLEGLQRIVVTIQKENGGRIAINKADQLVVLGEAFMIQREIVEIMKRLWQCEKKAAEKTEKTEERRERRVKDRKVESRGGVVAESSDSGEWQERKTRRRRTYAEVSGGNNGEKIEGRVVVTGGKGWKTPPPRPQAEEAALIIASAEEKDARRLADVLAKNVSVKDIGGAPRAVRTIRDGKLVVVPKDGHQKAKIVEAFNKVKGVDIRESRKMEPLLVVSGVARGLSDEEFLQKVRRGLGDGINVETGGIKIIKRVACSNPWKENIFLKTGIELFKVMVKRERIEIDCALCYVEEYLGLAMCFRCCWFGHVIKSCRETDVCHKCGGGHDGRVCRETRRKCINCYRIYGRAGDHSARDNCCPAMREILARSRKNIAYGN